tara:strand:- start:239304 stop:239516 length:213 start_codon:yes stop_codon:yes gene_type:complete
VAAVVFFEVLGIRAAFASKKIGGPLFRPPAIMIQKSDRFPVFKSSRSTVADKMAWIAVKFGRQFDAAALE